ncbi:unnamed protein product [Hyaloperonospora brassicae]|uniref:endo-polygalacturonase n=1 Tax=Hyaloperonospora brassicae TaxID=162125 RepID=A0AAV0U9E0_HYABA|nr:unnamed protein product [Hyaloperonospora brassicae]CAI5733535.1 unnamed protein product [Hyaloperonospora brassicae]CAI5733539.1 unnamed protein product [Hyaloperonospora brassicae]
MKLLPTALTALVLAVGAADGSLTIRTTAQGQTQRMSNAVQQSPVQEQQSPVQEQQSPVQEQQSLVQKQQSSSPISSNACILTGMYKKGTDISACSSITVDSLRVPPGVTLDLTKTKRGAVIEFIGTTTFGTKMWAGPLVMVSGTDLTVKGSGVLDGQGPWYWKYGPSILRPVFFRLQSVISSKVSGFTVKNMPFRTFSLVTCKNTILSGLTIDSRAGNGIAKNTDGFNLSKNDGVTITGNTIYNQDDCLAMQSSINTVFSNNYCCNTHGISIGSLGGNAVDASTTVRGLTISGNTIVNSVNGFRIKTIIGLKGLIADVKFINNKVQNVRNAVSLHANYDRGLGRYRGPPTSQVQITRLMVSGLTGTAEKVYDIQVNPKVISDWTFEAIDVRASMKSTIEGLPKGVAV